MKLAGYRIARLLFYAENGFLASRRRPAVPQLQLQRAAHDAVQRAAHDAVQRACARVCETGGAYIGRGRYETSRFAR